METAENRIIRESINSITNLPQGYTPNLQSKWELLEAGLNKKERKTALFYIKYLSGIAAALLLIGGAGLYMVKNNKPVKKPIAEQLKQEDVVKEPLMTSVISKPEKKAVKRSARAKRINMPTMPVKEEMAINEMIIDSIAYSAPSEAVQPLLATQKKASRFVELDFNEPVITDQVPSHVVVESKRFKFRIGSGNESNADVGSSGTSLIRLRKAFN